MDESEAIDLVTLAATMLPNCQDKSLLPTAKAWAVVMPDVDFETGRNAIIKIMREKKIPTIPLPGEILEAARGLRHNPTDPPTTVEAWEEVRKNIDVYTATKWSHPLIQKAVQAIGARTICEAEYDMSARFMKVYDSLVQREHIDQENAIAIEITTSGRINLIGGQANGRTGNSPLRTLRQGTKER